MGKKKVVEIPEDKVATREEVVAEMGEEAVAKAEAEAEVSEDTEVVIVPKKGENEATVTWNGGSRTYSREVHGENFADLAQEFATKKGGTVA